MVKRVIHGSISAYGKIQDGKVVSTAGTSIEAGTAAEANQKFLATHLPNSTGSYKVVSCVKK